MEESIKELAYSQASDVRGDVLSTSYELQGVLFLKKIKDAAKKRLYFEQACYVTSAPKGTKDVIIPRRTLYTFSQTVTEKYFTDPGGTAQPPAARTTRTGKFRSSSWGVAPAGCRRSTGAGADSSGFT